MQNPDSFDRIISYFHALASAPFTYRNRTIEPYASLRVSPLVFRSYTCPSKCGACCMRCSLVYDRVTISWAEEQIAKGDKRFAVDFLEVNSRRLAFVVDKQEDHAGRYCRYLDGEGRCGIYNSRPLPCRLELFKFVHTVSRNQAQALVRLPGRGHALARVTGEKGNACEIAPFDQSMTDSHVEDLDILRQWMNYLGIANNISDVMSYLVRGPFDKPLELFNL